MRVRVAQVAKFPYAHSRFPSPFLIRWESQIRRKPLRFLQPRPLSRTALLVLRQPTCRRNHCRYRSQRILRLSFLPRPVRGLVSPMLELFLIILHLRRLVMPQPSSWRKLMCLLSCPRHQSCLIAGTRRVRYGRCFRLALRRRNCRVSRLHRATWRLNRARNLVVQRSLRRVTGRRWLRWCVFSRKRSSRRT